MHGAVSAKPSHQLAVALEKLASKQLKYPSLTLRGDANLRLAAEVAVPCCGQVVSSCLHAAVAAPTGAPFRWNEKTPLSSPFVPPPPHPPTTSTHPSSPHPTTLLVRCLHYCGALAAWICPDCFLKFSRLLLRGEDAA